MSQTSSKGWDKVTFPTPEPVAEAGGVSDMAQEAAFRTMIAREIWAYNECPWDFDNPPEGMAQLQKQIAVDQAEKIRACLFDSALLRGYVAHHVGKYEEETYEIGKRDGYEDAIQDLDLATGGNGEFYGSTIPGQTVDVPAMKQRIIARALPPQPTGDANPEDVWEAYCRETPAKNWSPQGAMAFALDYANSRFPRSVLKDKLDMIETLAAIAYNNAGMPHGAEHYAKLRLEIMAARAAPSTGAGEEKNGR